MNDHVESCPIVAIAGLPRVGSMWTYNIARSLVRTSGLNVVPGTVPVADQDMFAAAEAYLKERPANARCVIKVHALINPSPVFLLIRNTRDIRDRLYSYLRFMKFPVNKARIREAVATTRNFDRHYDLWPAERILHIDFERIETSSLDVIRQISEFIGFPDIDEQILREVDVRFSKRQVKQKIADLEQRVLHRDGTIKDDVDPAAVLEGGGRVRAFDVNSGFQSGHVSDYRPGDWQYLWTSREKKIVNDAIHAAQGK